jgi:hypothetical protein
MLMSFPMFVVMVAVDSHWISTSLRSVYPDMLRDGPVTPDHYLEKIFQLPVWLDELTPEDARRMAAAIVGPPTSTGPVPSPETGAAQVSATGAPTGSAPASPPATTSSDGGVDLATSSPAAISLDDAERLSIPALAPLLTRSPRALKRYVNTYYLLKTLVAPDDLELARVLLAIAIGRPALGEQLFDAITAADATVSLGTVVDRLPEDSRKWIALTTETEWRKRDCHTAGVVVSQVRQFVFRSERRGSPELDLSTKPAR